MYNSVRAAKNMLLYMLLIPVTIMTVFPATDTILFCLHAEFVFAGTITHFNYSVTKKLNKLQ